MVVGWDVNRAILTMTNILCLGEPMVEFNQRPDGLFTQGFGGDTSNCAISAARQGAKVGYITRIGADQFGDKLLQLWQSEGIDTRYVIRDKDHATGIYFVTHDQSGHHYQYYRKHSAAASITPSDLDETAIAQATMIHVSAISQAISDQAAETVRAAIDIAKRHQTLVAYDTNLRLNLWSAENARSVVHEAMSHCDIALPSYDDATVLTGLTEPHDIVDFYLTLGANDVVLKRGAKGVIAANHEKRIEIPGQSFATIDSNGAGDTFAGALHARLSSGDTVFDAAEYANIAAGLSTTNSGAVAAIPTRKQTEDYINS